MKKTQLYLLISILTLFGAPANPIWALEAETVNQSFLKFNMWNIVIVGMIIIFLSLIVIAILVSLLRNFHKRADYKKNDRKKEIIAKKISKFKPIQNKEQQPPLDHNIQLAILTTIFLYENEIENQSKMLLTMKRTKTCTWKQSSRLLMPNFKIPRKFPDKNLKGTR